jgi:DnaJ-class molecular chaperone
MDPKKDYYKILGVNENASNDEIKKAYRKLAKQYHPDIRGGDKNAENRFKDISEAYAILKDPQKRKQYDMMRKNPFASGQGGFNYGDFGNRGGFRVNFGGGGDNFGGLDDLLGSFFGFGSRRGSSRTGFREDFQDFGQRAYRKGADFESSITIPFELAALGGETLVQTPTGKHIKIKIASGTDEGKKIKLTGQGSPAPRGGEPGDLYITISISAHPRFERKGNDIYSDEEISFAQAMFGTELEVKTINHQTVKLKIPAGTDSGKIFRLKNLGIQSAKGRGSHYVRVLIKSPKNLSSKLKKQFEEWAKTAGIEF